MEKKIILYSTGCPKCQVLKNKLKDREIGYTENNNVEEMLRLGVEQVPVLSVDGILYDFRQAIVLINKGEI